MGPSPAWMQRRLTLAGMRPISNVVDVTNYVMLDSADRCTRSTSAGSPGAWIVVRLAWSAGEKMTTLDGVERTLTSADLLHLRRGAGTTGHRGDHGRRGGRGLQLHHRDPLGVGVLRAERHRPAPPKRLGLRSEASARFERGVDPNNTATLARRARWELFAPGRGRSTGCGRDRRLSRNPSSGRGIQRAGPSASTRRLLGTSFSGRGRSREYLTPLGIEVRRRRGDCSHVFRPRPLRARSISSRKRRVVPGPANIAVRSRRTPRKIGGV